MAFQRKHFADILGLEFRLACISRKELKAIATGWRETSSRAFQGALGMKTSLLLADQSCADPGIRELVPRPHSPPSSRLWFPSCLFAGGFLPRRDTSSH